MTGGTALLPGLGKCSSRRFTRAWATTEREVRNEARLDRDRTYPGWFRSQRAAAPERPHRYHRLLGLAGHRGLALSHAERAQRRLLQYPVECRRQARGGYLGGG